LTRWVAGVARGTAGFLFVVLMELAAVLMPLLLLAEGLTDRRALEELAGGGLFLLRGAPAAARYLRALLR
jgi:hypothetical protein